MVIALTCAGSSTSPFRNIGPAQARLRPYNVQGSVSPFRLLSMSLDNNCSGFEPWCVIIPIGLTRYAGPTHLGSKADRTAIAEA